MMRDVNLARMQGNPLVVSNGGDTICKNELQYAPLSLRGFQPVATDFLSGCAAAQQYALNYGSAR
jgi:hypothetical protein